ncbi:LLM class flavin-dependent oxidoreductase [Phyllobacterium sp. 628]|uniref:LLM class flavin-dependent oxidoreductase n=1 Tax=Phyllobacterium sp. 628 TaxID=2718938 RepID=UPI00166283A6|nr:LLM class flavin-dependent oxidoreductase [Phyllobacterium sp. 628]QND52580.1 LLM class flavin-dependent oxidoreductase [Phyllobacterium sp. 628]
MHIGLALSPFGHHPAAWREMSGDTHALGFTHLAAQVKAAEEGGFDFVLLADRFGHRPLNSLSPLAVPFEPTTLVAALATVANRIGFVATASTSQHEPYNLARRFASMDSISEGRTGWNIIISEQLDRDHEYLEVVRGLWDSWEDDAFVYDKVRGRVFEPDKMHVLNHKGTYFTVRGPLNVNRSPQGRPVITQSLTPETIELAARSADVIFLAASSLDDAKVLISEFLHRLQIAGRERQHVRILANAVPYIGKTSEDAQALFDRLGSQPVLPDTDPQGLQAIGTAVDIVDTLQLWTQTLGIDGFIILPPIVLEGVTGFVDAIVPELQRRGLFRNAYDGKTLRDHLGLPYPPHPATRKERES